MGCLRKAKTANPGSCKLPASFEGLGAIGGRPSSQALTDFGRECTDFEGMRLTLRPIRLGKEHGFDICDVLDGRGGKGKRGKVAIEYRDPSNPANTWTGRRRKAKKEDFLIS